LHWSLGRFGSGSIVGRAVASGAGGAMEVMGSVGDGDEGVV
jgi:hypothetical protein